MYKLLNGLDRFGYRMELHYKGKPTFTTGFGGCVTLLVYVLIAINTINICEDFLNNDNQREIYRVINEDFSKLGEHKLIESGFECIVGDLWGPKFGRF